MFAIGNEELKELPIFKGRVFCLECEEFHEVSYSKKILPDGQEVKDGMLAGVRCNGNDYLVAFGGRFLKSKVFLNKD